MLRAKDYLKRRFSQLVRRKNKHIKEYIRADGTKVYRFQAYLGMKGRKRIQVSRSGFKSYSEALATYNKIIAEGVTNYVKPQQMTFSQLWDKWWKTYLLDVKSSTARKTREIYQNDLEPYFGKQYVDKMTPDDIADYFVSLAKKKKTFKKSFNYLHKVLEYGVDIHLINTNPARKTLLPKKSPVKGRDTSKNFYDLEELKKFLDCAKQIDERTYVFYLLLGSTGLRKSEALALNWSDIDFDESKINITKTLAFSLEGKYIIQDPKSEHSKRAVPLSANLSDALKHYRNDLSPLVFHTAGGNYLRPSKPDHWLKRVYKVFPDLKQITPHGFRHSFDTIINNQPGVNPKDVQRIMGHASLDMTMETYNHSTEKGRKEIESKINSII